MKGIQLFNGTWMVYFYFKDTSEQKYIHFRVLSLDDWTIKVWINCSAN